MGQPPRSVWDELDQEIAELEAELDLAYQMIDQLQWEKYELQKQVKYLQSALLRNEASGLRSQKPPQRLKQDSAGSPKRSSRRRVKKRSKLNLAALAFAVIVGFATVGLVAGLAVKNLLNETPKPSVEPSTRSLNSPSSRLVSPSIDHPLQLGYNIKKPPNLKPSNNLQAIVNDIVSLAQSKNLPNKPLSITLIDVNYNEIAGYKQDKPRYPASVVKLFWMVPVYAMLEKGVVPDEATFDYNLGEMIKNSDNNAASRILDKITDTQSGLDLNGEEYQTWLQKRQQVNRFFEDAGYERINITQKTYPISYLQMQEPQGSDLKMRGDDPKQPVRNQVTTYHAARLMYEILAGQAVSPEASKKMLQLLTRDVRAEVWKQQPPNPLDFNPVESFFGESLPADVQFASKAGLTSDARHEVAGVATKDGGTVYVLAVFASSLAYASDNKIFPEMSRLVHRRMTDRRSNR